MSDATLIYDASARSYVAGAAFTAVSVLGILAFFMFPVFWVLMVYRRQASRPRWRYRTIRNKILVCLLAGCSLVIPMLVMVLVVSIRWSEARASLAIGHFFSVTGRLVNVRFEKSAVGRGPVPRIIEHDVLTLQEGNSFEIDCAYNSNEPPRTEQSYACLNAQIGDDLTVASTASLGNHGAVPALRIWRNDNS